MFENSHLLVSKIVVCCACETPIYWPFLDKVSFLGEGGGGGGADTWVNPKF